MKVQLRQRLEAPSDTVFGDVSDFGNLARLDVVAACTVEGNGVGAVRTVTFTDPTLGRVVERLESYDPIVLAQRPICRRDKRASTLFEFN